MTDGSVRVRLPFSASSLIRKVLCVAAGRHLETPVSGEGPLCCVRVRTERIAVEVQGMASMRALALVVRERETPVLPLYPSLLAMPTQCP